MGRSMVLNWRRKGAFDRPAQSQSGIDVGRWDILEPGPLSDGLSLPPERKIVIGTSIVLLFGSCCPSAVLGRVWSIVINAVKRMLWRWARSHVSQKVVEGITPTLAHDYAAAAIDGIRMKVHTIATVLGTTPCRILWCVGHAMSSRAQSHGFSAPTATTFGGSSTQIGTINDRGVSAIADAMPKANAGLCVSEANNRKSVKALSYMVYHGPMITPFMPTVNFPLCTWGIGEV